MSGAATSSFVAKLIQGLPGSTAALTLAVVALAIAVFHSHHATGRLPLTAQGFAVYNEPPESIFGFVTDPNEFHEWFPILNKWSRKTTTSGGPKMKQQWVVGETYTANLVSGLGTEKSMKLFQIIPHDSTSSVRKKVHTKKAIFIWVTK